jgi:hypothetical protein
MNPRVDPQCGLITFAISPLIMRTCNKSVTELDLNKSYLSFGAQEIIQDFCITVLLYVHLFQMCHQVIA